MTRIILSVLGMIICIGGADAAVRDATSLSRNATNTTQRLSTRQPNNQKTNKNVISRTSAANTIARSVSDKNIRTKSTQNSTVNARTGTTIQKTSVRSAKQPSVATSGRSATTTIPRTTKKTQNVTARAGIITPDASTAFGTGYTACRDAYFTCMDQFCASADDSYRRCVCSSKLTDVQSRERALSQSATQIQDFKDLNINVITKTGAEVTAMLSATSGETAQANAKDTSDSAKQLSNITSVLSGTKTKSLSTQSKLDIADDINQIWAASDLTGGANIINLTGEPLYNAVHAQCLEMVANSCPDTSIQKKVVSAYGMYIENDCSMLIKNLDDKLTAANATIRETEREMYDARLENYDAHNSTPINDCIAQVRQDITNNMACGTDYVHCLDITGKYLNYETGEPIYSSEFFELETAISLSGDILKNQTNRPFIDKLNKMRIFASRGLDTCRDLSDDVWDEFMRQAITEIRQGQQERIRQVKDECLDAVNKCYDTQQMSLKDFSNIDDGTLLGSRLELSETLCQEKLNTCSNLYGGGDHGMQELVATMFDITTQQISQECSSLLEKFAINKCTPTSYDTLHGYPYACRVYAPGEQRFATIPNCNKNRTPTPETLNPYPKKILNYICPSKTYTSCNYGYFLQTTGKYYNPSTKETTTTGNENYIEIKICTPCPEDDICLGGTNGPESQKENGVACGTYPGSLYQQLADYARQVCTRPSQNTDSDSVLSTQIIADINVLMGKIHSDMSNELSKECERMGGIWVNLPYVHTSSEKVLEIFYKETSANSQWGYCAPKTEK